MPRIKLRDFSGGLHVTGNADDQPRNTLRVARNIQPPTAGRLRASSGYVDRYTNVLASLAIDGMFRFQGNYYAEGMVGATRHLRRHTAAGNVAAAWNAMTYPAVVGDGSQYDPTDDDSNDATADGSQPAVLLATIGSDSKFCTVLAPPIDGADEMMFLCDTRSTARGQLFKIETATTGATSRWGILSLVDGDTNGINLALATQEKTYLNIDANGPAGAPTDPIGTEDGTAIGAWVMASGDEDTLSAAAARTYNTNAFISARSLKVVAGKNDVVTVTRTFGSAINMAQHFSTTASVDADFVQFFVRPRRLKHLENIEIAFSSEAAGTFVTDFYSRELTFKRVKRRKKRKLIGLGDLVRKRKIEEFLKDNQGVLKDLTFTEEMYNTQEIPAAKNTWSRVTLPKATFQESGTPNWSTIYAIRFTVHANKQGKTAVFFDELSFNGSAGMVGDYEYAFTLRNSSTETRSNPNISEEGVVARSKIEDVERQGVDISLGAMVFDAQADQLEVWRTVGNGVQLFKVGHLDITGTAGTIVDNSDFTDMTADYIGLHSGTLDYTDATASSGTFTGFATLQADPVLPLDNDSPNDPAFIFQDAVGIHVGRMWWTRNVATTDVWGNTQDPQGHVYYSPVGRYEAVQSFIQVTSGTTEPVQKLTVWNDRLFAITTAGLYAIVGTNEPFVAVKVEGAPGTTRPNTFVGSQHGLFWVAQDGVYRFNGSFAENISDKDLEPVFKNKEAVEDFPVTMDFTEAAVAHNALWLASDTRGAGGAGGGEFPTLVLDFTTRTWRTVEGTRFLFYDAFATDAIFSGLDGQMLGARLASTSEIHDLAPVPFDTSNTQVFNIKTGHVRAGPGQTGILRKFWIDHDRQGETIIVKADIDDSDTTFTAISAGSGRTVSEFKPLRSGERFAIELEVTACNSKVEIYGIELDIYVPGEKLGESGLQ